MAFNQRFSFGLTFRLIALLVVMIGLAGFVAHGRYYVVCAVLLMACVGLTYELSRYIGKTNRELSRFLEAFRYEDFSQDFNSIGQGAGFDELAQQFKQIMQSHKTRRQQQELQLSCLAAMLEHIPVPLISIEEDKAIKLHNNAARQLFAGADVNKLDDLKQFGPDFHQHISQLLAGDKQLLNFEHRGTERQLSVLATELVLEKQQQTLFSLLDIQNELDSTQQQAWQDLVGVLSHEIMNSITPVASLADTAKHLVDEALANVEGANDVASLQSTLEDAQQAVSTVARRSDGLMRFVENYRSLRQLPKPRKQAVNLHKLISNIGSLLANQWQTPNLVFNYEIATNIELHADPDLLEQLFINLLKNSDQALQHHKSPTIELEAGLDAYSRIKISVSDNGPGIDQDKQKLVFLPFYSNKPEGSGIGLALARQVMMAHGGSIRLEVSEAGGCRFSLLF